MPDECKHIDGEWPLFGQRIKYRAHIQSVRGRDRSQEVVDDIHIEIDPLSVTSPRAMEYLSNDKRRFDLCKQIATSSELLDKYLMQGMTPPKPE